MHGFMINRADSCSACGKPGSPELVDGPPPPSGLHATCRQGGRLPIGPSSPGAQPGTPPGDEARRSQQGEHSTRPPRVPLLKPIGELEPHKEGA